MLVETPGEVVTREELYQNGTIVEFDASINAAIKRLHWRIPLRNHGSSKPYRGRVIASLSLWSSSQAQRSCANVMARDSTSSLELSSTDRRLRPSTCTTFKKKASFESDFDVRREE